MALIGYARVSTDDQTTAAQFEDGFGLFAFVAGQVVEDDDVARSQGGGKLGLDIGFEENLVHGALDDPGGGEAIAPQGGDESLGAPMAEWRFGLEPLTALGSPAQPGHLGGGVALEKWRAF